MGNSFSQLISKVRDRNFGGTAKTVAPAEPYITGYFFIHWILPDNIIKYLDFNSISGTENQTETPKNIDETNNYLSSLCIGVTPVGGTFTKTEFLGLQGNKVANPLHIEYGNTVSVKYLELSGLPIHRIHHAWCNMIRQNRNGLTVFKGEKLEEGTFSKNNYSATLFYWTTKPDGITLENYAAYSGVYPNRDPQDSYPSDIAAIDKVELEMDYNVDFVWQDPWVANTINKKFIESNYKNFAGYRKKVEGEKNI